MDDLRESLFGQLRDPLLNQLTDSDYEKKIYSYLNTLKTQHQPVLQVYSKKLQSIKNLEWLNIPQDSNFVETSLNGHLVIIDFWTYCCINCMHVMPLLHKLERQFKDLITIGIHSSKFSNEKSKANIAHAMKRHRIYHPVVCDPDLKLWQDMEIICWPTLLVVNPQGLVIGEFQGEIQANLLPRFIDVCFKYYQDCLCQKASLPVPVTIHGSINQQLDSVDHSRLKFPTKLLVHGETLFISDSGNNRIVLVDVESKKVKLVIGNGRCGHKDSDFENSCFDWPQGLAYDSKTNFLYIADTFNDVIRAADLNKKIVSTVCGVSNKIGFSLIGEYDYVGGGSCLDQRISSPWDVCLIEKDENKVLLIACAGTHQVWLCSIKNDLKETKQDYLRWWKGLNFQKGTLRNIAGNGKERNKNNSYPLQASFAQPSSLDYNSKLECVYLADAESSTIRVLSLKDGSVKNVVGGDSLQPDNLFVYGDCDGKGCEARLQHPLDAKFLRFNNEDSLLVADTYNNALKLVDLKTKYCRKVCLSEKSLLSEPNCVCVDEASGRVWITDTNNHLIKYIEDLNATPCCRVEIFSIEFDKSISTAELKNRNGVFLKIGEEIKVNLNAVNSWSLVIRRSGEKLEYSGELNNDNKLGIENMQGFFRLISCEFDFDGIEEVELYVSFVCCAGVQSSDVCRVFKKRMVLSRNKIIELIEQSREEYGELGNCLALRIIDSS